jgi:T5SS/PEP-CTERM-associated repeat protein
MVYGNTTVEINGSIDWTSFQVTQGATGLSLCCTSVLNYTWAQAYYTDASSNYDWQYAGGNITTEPWLDKAAAYSIADGSTDGYAESAASMDSSAMRVSISGTNDFLSVGSGQLNLGTSSQRIMYYALPSKESSLDTVRIAYDYEMTGLASTQIAGDQLNIYNTDAWLAAYIRNPTLGFLDAGAVHYQPPVRSIADGASLSFSHSGKLELLIDPTKFTDWGNELYVHVEMRANSSSQTVTATSLPIDKYWIGDSDSWNIGDRWNPAGEPATGDAIHLETDDDDTRVVTYATTLADPKFSSLRIDATKSGSITLQQSQDALGVAGGYSEIGWAGQGTFKQDGGTSIFDTVIVGSKAGSDGLVSLSGGTTTINRLVVAEQAGSTGNVEVHTGGNLNVLTDAVIGEGGNGTFVQDGGTSAITTMIVGAKSGSTGSVGLSGGTTTINRLVVAEQAGSTGSVAVSGTGALSVSTDAVIGEGGTGSFSLSGGSLTVGRWGTIGVSNTGSFSQTDGTSSFSRVVLGLTSTGIGAFNLTGGTSTIGELVLGHDDGSKGTLNLGSAGNLVVTGDATIGSGSVGEFNQSGGTANVGSYLFVGRAPSGEGTVNLSGGQLSANQLTVGHDPGATGDVNLSGDGRLLVDGLTLGLAGSGDLMQTGGTLEVAGDLHLGQAEGGWGTYTLMAGQSNIGGSAYIGEGKDSVGVYLHAGGITTINDDIKLGGASGSIGYLIQDGGHVQVADVVAVGTDSGHGTYVLADIDAMLTAREVRVGSNGTLLGIGTIDADVVNDGGFIGPGLSPGTLNIDGDFTLIDGVLEIEVGGLAAGDFDVLNITGKASFTGGTILFSFIDGFLPSEDDMFKFLVADTVSDFNSTLAYSGAAPGFEFKVTDGGNGLLIFIALNDADAVPEPATLVLFAAGLAVLGAVRRKKLAA